MAAITLLNPKAEVVRKTEALSMNQSAAKGLQDVMKTNLGPRGTMKMLVSGAGDIKITKDGNVLLKEMQIQHPTASLIARTSTAMDDITGDGTTSTVLLIAELLKKADSYIIEGVHPRLITEGFTVASKHAMQVLDSMKKTVSLDDKETLIAVARTALKTKVESKVAEVLTQICVEAVQAIKLPDKPLDLHMIEIMTMQSRLESETRLVRGLVLDHGSRHPNMPKKLTNAYILTCNVSLEFEKTEINSGFFYKSAEEREKLVASEREFIELRVKKIIALKKSVCDGTDKGFVVINQKGIDPVSLDMLAREGIMALRRAKRRNMERLTLACGGVAMNSLDDLTEDCLGQAGLVYEHVLGETKYTFVSDCPNPHSVTVLVHGPTSYAITQIQDALRDGLRAVKNAVEDGGVLPGGGAVELKLRHELKKVAEKTKEKYRVGIEAFCDALLIIPKTLAMNSGFNTQEVITQLDYDAKENDSIGLDLQTGKSMIPTDLGILDNYSVKKQYIASSVIVASNLLLVDEVMRAGMSSLKG